MRKVELVTTLEGSHSLFIADLDEQYHSKYGAIQESQHVFINAGLKYQAEQFNEINILEVGFGTGLNALLTLQYAIENQLKINYYTIEPFPLAEEITTQLNYPNYLEEFKTAKNYFQELHTVSWNENHSIHQNFNFTKYQTTLQAIQLAQQFHLCYYDAFAPSAQPELWTTAIFQKIYDNLLPNAVLVTYCAKGQVKRNFKSIGFQLEALSGPKGKREMVRAKKNEKK
ncbi:MAG: tRNA (5-methylaminomethyl-2-thiouridine)(34)-methyltransferase MnmD [Chitinophagales bacterium]|nr:tRNA (5-methylaminomethyl-2-thiouridine)(34)-methyltransferase MnmD [Chitinophagales bacterium]